MTFLLVQLACMSRMYLKVASCKLKVESTPLGASSWFAYQEDVDVLPQGLRKASDVVTTLVGPRHSDTHTLSRPS